jgi:hypothetical protein
MQGPVVRYTQGTKVVGPWQELRTEEPESFARGEKCGHVARGSAAMVETTRRRGARDGNRGTTKRRRSYDAVGLQRPRAAEVVAVGMGL